MTYDTGFILDGLILVFLAVTIFYAARLSLFLKSFRDGRNGMQILIRDLSTTIDKAESSIQVMKQQILESESELREIVNEAKFLSDELRFMNETGDGLAERLEKLADRNREFVNLIEQPNGVSVKNHDPASGKLDEPFDIEDFEIDEDDERDFWALGDGAYREEEAYKPRIDTKSKSKVQSFAIFDRDYSDDDAPEDQDNSSQFKSRAEQDLYEALQRKKRVREIS